MSIVNKIQLAQEKVLEIFQLLEEQGLDVTNQNSLVELKEAVQEYINSHHGKANFTILNSVSTNGNQFLDTGIKMNNNIGVELKFKLED
jgi:nucleoside diphosphate kinase